MSYSPTPSERSSARERPSDRLLASSVSRRHASAVCGSSRTYSIPWSKAQPAKTRISRAFLKLREFPNISSSRRAKGGFMSMPTLEFRCDSHSFTASAFTTQRSNSSLEISRFFSLWERSANSLPVMPNSRLAMASDLVSIIFLCYDYLTIPYLLAWNVQIEGFFLWMGFIIGLFWIFDMVLHFLKSFARDGEIVVDLKKIVVHYIKGRFFTDIFILSIDWVGIIMDFSSSKRNYFYKWAKFARVLKITRLLRLVSLWKSGRVAQLKEHLLQKMRLVNMPTTVVFIGNMLKIVFLILIFNHVVSCMFVGMLGSSWHDTASGWEFVISEMHGGTTFDDAGLSNGYRYFVAYYWSISTMFSGSSFLAPMSTLESVFSAVYVLFGVLFASGMISSMAAMLMESNEMNRSKNTNLQTLHRYLQQESIDSMTSFIIMRQAAERLTKHRRVTDKDISTCLDILAPELRDKLHFTVWNSVLISYPLWRACVYVDDQLVKNLCKFAVKVHTFAPGKMIFEPGCPKEESYMIIWGTMSYTLEDFDQEAGLGGENEPTASTSNSIFLNSLDLQHFTSLPSRTNENSSTVLVDERQHICEIALWSEWTTLGELETISHGEYLSCDSKAILEIVVPSSKSAHDIMRSYAKALLEYIDLESVLRLSDLNSALDYDSIVRLMPQEPRVLMSLPIIKALKVNQVKNASNHEVWQDLETEVVQGVCNLSSDETGRCMRCVKVVSLCLRNAEGRDCFKLGEVSADGVYARIDFPGGKMQPREPLSECVERLVCESFPGWRSDITLENYHLQVDVKESPAHGLQTKYMRTVVKGYSSFEAQTVKIDWMFGAVHCFLSRKNDGGFRVFAWLSPVQHEKLRTLDQGGEAIVTQWLKHLQVHYSSEKVDELDEHPTTFACTNGVLSNGPASRSAPSKEEDDSQVTTGGGSKLVQGDVPRNTSDSFKAPTSASATLSAENPRKSKLLSLL